MVRHSRHGERRMHKDNIGDALTEEALTAYEVGLADPAAASRERAISFGPFRLLPKQRLLLEGNKQVGLGSRALGCASLGRPLRRVARRSLPASKQDRGLRRRRHRADLAGQRDPPIRRSSDARSDLLRLLLTSAG
jgi:hypothetical protein